MIVQPMSQACPETCPFAAEMMDPSMFLGEFFVWEGYGNQISEMLTSRYQPVYMAVCIGLATFIFSQLVNLH